MSLERDGDLVGTETSGCGSDGDTLRTSWPLEAAALFGLLLALVVLSVSLLGHVERAELLGYGVLLVVGPFLAGAAAVLLSRRVARWDRAASIDALAGVVVCLLLLVLAGALEQASGIRLLFVAVPLGSALVIVAFVAPLLFPAASWRPSAAFAGARRSAWFVLLLLLAVLLFMAVFSPLYPGDPRFAALVGWATDRPLFLLLLVIGWPCVLALLVFASRLDRPWLGWLLLLAGLCVSLLLYDDGQFVVHDHYQAYMGSALFAMAGGVPMVEVYNQYGLLPWLLIWLAYEVLPPTFGTFGLLFRLCTVLWLGVFVLSVYRVVENKVLGGLLALIGLLWIVTFHINIFNLSGLPSTQGYRYLVPSLTVLVLTLDEKGRARWLSLAAISAVASLWSAETFLFAVGPIGAMAFLDMLRERSWRGGLRAALPVVAGALVAQGLFAAWMLLRYGMLPDYGPYLEIIGHFQPGGENEWVVLINPYFGLWIPLAFVLFLPIATAARDAFLGRDEHHRVRVLVPAAVLGIAQLSYFVGRSTNTTLGLALSPFLIVALGYVDLWVAALLRRASPGRWPQLILLAALIATVFAFATERMARPFEESRATANILRRCFTDVGCAPADVFERIRWNIRTLGREMRQDDPRYAVVEGESLQARILELEQMIADFYAGGGTRIPLFVDTIRLPYIGTLALADTGNWYHWPMSSPLNDFKSKRLLQRAIDSVGQLQTGDALIVEKEPEKLLDEIRLLLGEVAARCRLDPVRNGSFYDVFALQDCIAPGS